MQTQITNSRERAIVPSPEALLRDASTPFWAADVIHVALTKDCTDAAGVFELLAKSFGERAKQLSDSVLL